ncbi:hypothetical protein C7441_105119 [Pseudaminobacter salicylatoxidans]|uniref:DUF4352 domain-containing protein n=1 Tax=Pseudaminobacter salicylatoxidans TaxID=93369 RepID=A0A316C5C0_PSESE|nr:hypothetical protein [Pseudaminobacter salicylatoxidans]PWJ84503.1 hypothetical protein C7441_105119 [Pseudaminobacter salicylatoxidans]
MATEYPNTRKHYWICLVLLLVLIPAAILMHSRGAFIEWIAQASQEPITVERGKSQPYAGGNWRLVDLSPLPGRLPDTNVLLAELEIAIDDPVRIKQALPCSIWLIDKDGRRWEPAFLSEPVVRQMRPDAVGKPHCFNLPEIARAGTVQMFETFLIPHDAEGLALSVSMTGEQPLRLLLE